jgi:ABC-type transport system involved in cytochrome c biogenesis permease component
MIFGLEEKNFILLVTSAFTFDLWVYLAFARIVKINRWRKRGGLILPIILFPPLIISVIQANLCHLGTIHATPNLYATIFSVECIVSFAVTVYFDVRERRREKSGNVG